jgi:hypothetical protein
LGDRDILPNGKRCYELLLEYHYSCDGACSITPHAPLLNGAIYDAFFDAQLVMIFDENKQLMGTCDAFPKPIALKKEGKHVLRYSVRHDSLAKLEPLMKMLVYVDRKLKDEISLPICSHSFEVATGGKGGGSSAVLMPGKTRSIVLGEVASDKLPKGSNPGDVLIGIYIHNAHM